MEAEFITSLSFSHSCLGDEASVKPWDLTGFQVGESPEMQGG